MNSLSTRILKVEYAEVKVVIICKIKPPIHRAVALSSIILKDLTAWYWKFQYGSSNVEVSISNSVAGKRANFNISKLFHIIWNSVFGLYKEGKIFFRVERSILIMVEKKRICGRFHFFMLDDQNFAYRGNRKFAKVCGFEVSVNR